MALRRQGTSASWRHSWTPPLHGDYSILVDASGDGQTSSGKNLGEIIDVLRRSLELYRPGFRFRGYIEDLSGADAAGCTNILVPDVSGAAIDALLHHFHEEPNIAFPVTMLRHQ